MVKSKSKSKTKPADNKVEPKIKEIKPETKQDKKGKPIELNEDFVEEILTAESRGRAMPIMMSGQIQEKPVDSLEGFADSLPSTNDSEKDDKGYAVSTKYGGESYTGAKNYEASDKKDYESSSGFIPERRVEEERSPFTTPAMQSSSTREQESRESLEKFARQQQQYQTQRQEDQNQPAFRHKEKRE